MANYYVRSGAGGAGTGADWANAFTTLTAALAGATNADTLWVANDHAESTAGGVTLTCPITTGLRILCVNTNATEPPTGLAATATVTTTGTNSISVNGFAYIYGIVFSNATGTGNASMIIGSGGLAHGLVFEDCKFTIATTGSTTTFTLGFAATATGDDASIYLINPVFKFAATAQSIRAAQSMVRIVGATIDSTGSTPTTLVTAAAATPINFLMESSDLSAETFTNLIGIGVATFGTAIFRNIKMPAFTSVTTGTIPGPGGVVVKMHNCDSADTHIRYSENRWEGTCTNEGTLVRTGGAVQADSTAHSIKMVGTANSTFDYPLTSPEFSIFNTATGSAKTVTVEILRDSVTNLQDDDVWLEVDYLGTSGFPQGTRINDRMTNVFSTPADQTTSSETWTTTGMSNPNKQKLAVTFTPQEAGYIHARVKLAVNTTVYVDPVLTIS